ncbi:unnamed protein product, partial [Ectocarpus sp. 6 AP-2014]
FFVQGDSVNLAARLMQRAVSEDGGVMCELATKRACGGLLQFKGRGDFRIKGKTAAAKVFQPYPEDFPKPDPPQYLGANVYGLIHQQQRQNYAMHKLLTSLQAYFARPAVKESRISLLQHKIALVGTGTGSVVLLEGLPGAGKTEVLSVFAARTMPRKALIHFTAASPYHVNKGFGGWSMVLQQYLDSLYKQEAVAGNQDFSGHGGLRRPSVPPVANGGEQANGASILGQQPLGGRDRMLLRELEGFPEMHAYAFLVNDVLGTNIPNNRKTWDTASSSMNADGMNGNESDSSDFDESSSVGHEQRVKLSILLQLVKSMAASKPRIVVIDDAQFLDKDSWTLALQIATCEQSNQRVDDVVQ